MLETKGQIFQSQKPFSKDSYLILLLLRPQTCLFPSRSWIFACAVSSLGNRVNFSTQLIADHPGAGVRAVFALDHKYALLISIFFTFTYTFSTLYNNPLLSLFKSEFCCSLTLRPWKICLTFPKPQFPHL